MTDLIRNGVIIIGMLGLGYFISQILNSGHLLQKPLNELELSIEDVALDLQKDETERIIKDPVLQDAFSKNIGQDDYGNYYIKQIGVTGDGDFNTPKNDYFIKVGPYAEIIR